MVDNQKEMSKSIIVLSVIALIAGLLLSLVYQFTRITEAEKMQKITQNLNTIYNAQNGYEEIITSSNEGKNNFFKAKGEDYYIVVGTGQGYGGTLEAYVSFEGTDIVNLKIGKNSDTPGIRDNAFNSEYLKQYYIDIYNVVFEFSERGFDKAAGATGTSNGILSAVKNAVSLYKSYLGGRIE